MGNYSPFVISKNGSANKLRIQVDEKEESKRFPLGRFPFRSVINFGSRTDTCYEKVELIEENGIILNHPDLVGNASHKGICKRALINAGIPTPKFYDLRDFSKIDLKFPVVMKLYRGSGGEGMILCKTNEELVKAYKSLDKASIKDYFVEEVFQPDLAKSYEFRISVAPLLYGKRVDYPGGENSLGEIVSLRKLMTQEAADKGAFGRNIALGHSYFTTKFDRVFKGKGGSKTSKANIDYAVNIAIEAVNACNLDFGAVDMIYDSESNGWTVLEINTAPSLGDEERNFSANQWKIALRELLLEKYHLTK